jgi:hypothetical protein
LRYLVQWHADVCVPQQMRVIEDELFSDDVLGNFLHDVWELKRKDPIANPNSVVWAHLYRTKFFEGDRVTIDNPLLIGDKFHAFPLRPLLELVNAKCNKHYREYKLRDAIRASFKMREGVDHPNHFPVRRLDLSKKCLSDQYRDAGGELPCESQLESHIENGSFPMMCMLVQADVVNEKIGISHAPPTPCS